MLGFVKRPHGTGSTAVGAEEAAGDEFGLAVGEEDDRDDGRGDGLALGCKVGWELGSSVGREVGAAVKIPNVGGDMFVLQTHVAHGLQLGMPLGKL